MHSAFSIDQGNEFCFWVNAEKVKTVLETAEILPSRAFVERRLHEEGCFRWRAHQHGPSPVLWQDVLVASEHRIWHSPSSNLTHTHHPVTPPNLLINVMGIHPVTGSNSSSQQPALHCVWKAFLKEHGRAFVKEKSGTDNVDLVHVSQKRGCELGEPAFLCCSLCHAQGRGGEKWQRKSTDKQELPQRDHHASHGQIRLIGPNIIESDSYSPRLSGLIYWLTSLSTCCKHISSWTSNHSLTWRMINRGCLCDEGVARLSLKREYIFHNYINSGICPYSWRSADRWSAIVSSL